MSTMSVRVLSPAVLSKIRAPKGGNGRAAAIVGVRRNLFGSPGATAKALADLELNRATDEGCLRWGFDFRTECPLAGKNRFEWKPIGPKQTILCPDVISSTPAITPAVITPAITLATVTPMEVELQPTQKIEKKTRTEARTRQKPEPPMIQTRITDFLKLRKRPASGDSAPPAKLARHTSGDSASPAKLARPSLSAVPH